MIRFLVIALIAGGISGCALSDQAEFSRKCSAGIPYAAGTADPDDGASINRSRSPE